MGDSIASFYFDNGLDICDPEAIEKFLFPEEYILDNLIEDLAERTYEILQR